MINTKELNCGLVATGTGGGCAFTIHLQHCKPNLLMTVPPTLVMFTFVHSIPARCRNVYAFLAPGVQLVYSLVTCIERIGSFPFTTFLAHFSRRSVSLHPSTSPRFWYSLNNFASFLSGFDVVPNFVSVLQIINMVKFAYAQLTFFLQAITSIRVLAVSGQYKTLVALLTSFGFHT